MSAYLAGLAILRCAEHERAAEIDGSARLTLAGMASFAGKGSPPMCVAAQGTIAARVGLSVSSVARAQLRLHKLGIIDPDGSNGRGLSFTLRWRLTLLFSVNLTEERGTAGLPDPSSVNLTEEQNSSKITHVTEERPVNLTEEGSVNLTDNPSDSSRPQGREGGGRRDQALTRRPSADAAGTAPAPSNEPAPVSRLVAEVVAARGGTTEDAQRWIERRLSASASPVRNETAFIRQCLARERDSGDPAPTKPTKAAAKAPATTKAAPKPAAPAACKTKGCRNRVDRRTAEGKAGLCGPCGVEAWRVAQEAAKAAETARPTASPPPSTPSAPRPAQRASGTVAPVPAPVPRQPWQPPVGPDPFGVTRPPVPDRAADEQGGYCAECGHWITADNRGHALDCAPR